MLVFVDLQQMTISGQPRIEGRTVSDSPDGYPLPLSSHCTTGSSASSILVRFALASSSSSSSSTSAPFPLLPSVGRGASMRHSGSAGDSGWIQCSIQRSRVTCRRERRISLAPRKRRGSGPTLAMIDAAPTILYSESALGLTTKVIAL